jgi:hypothetical protein
VLSAENQAHSENLPKIEDRGDGSLLVLQVPPAVHVHACVALLFLFSCFATGFLRDLFKNSVLNYFSYQRVRIERQNAVAKPKFNSRAL